MSVVFGFSRRRVDLPTRSQLLEVEPKSPGPRELQRGGFASPWLIYAIRRDFPGNLERKIRKVGPRKSYYFHDFRLSKTDS